MSCGFTDVVKEGEDYICSVCRVKMPESWVNFFAGYGEERLKAHQERIRKEQNAFSR